jgi:hypothetical protein
MMADQHPDIEHLDAYADGDHAPSSVAPHIRDCPQCRDTVTALQRVRRELAALASVTMPDDVAERLRAALAAERASRSREERPGNSRIPAAGRPALSGWWPPGRNPRGRTRTRRGERAGSRPRTSPSPRVPAWFTAACLIVVVGMAGLVLVVAHHPGRATTSEASSQLPASPPGESPGPGPATGAQSTGEATSASVDDAGGPAIFAHTGHPVNLAEIPRHVLDLVTGRIQGTLRVPLQEYAVPNPATAGSSAAVASVITELTRPDLRMCYLDLITRTGGRIIALDLMIFNGRPAVLVVLSVPKDTDQVRVVVLDEQCDITNMAAAQWYSTTTPRK